MKINVPTKSSAALSGASLVFISSILDASARLVASSDIRDQVTESKISTKVKGDECIKLEAHPSVEGGIENIDVGILGCGQTLTCRKDKSSSSGARCVDFEELGDGSSYTDCYPYMIACGSDNHCTCEDNPVHYKCCTFPFRGWYCMPSDVGWCKSDSFW